VAVDKKSSRRKFRGELFINREQCKGCGFCVEFCPTHVLAMDKEINQKGYHTPVIVDLEVCTGCDLCGLFCPDFAIHAVRVKIESPGTDRAADGEGATENNDAG
jgi:2-oxoglutarate ferredoxin oxidoreductase subunit delta